MCVVLYMLSYLIYLAGNPLFFCECSYVKDSMNLKTLYLPYGIGQSVHQFFTQNFLKMPGVSHPITKQITICCDHSFLDVDHDFYFRLQSCV